MVSVKGTYRNGVVHPDEPVEGHDGQAVLITFLEETQVADLPPTTAPSFEQDRNRRADEEAFERERLAYVQLADSLRSHYEGFYVAIRGGQVVDSDPDELTLIARVYDRFGYGPMYVRKVGSPPPVERMPSPRVVTS